MNACMSPGIVYIPPSEGHCDGRCVYTAFTLSDWDGQSAAN